MFASCATLTIRKKNQGHLSVIRKLLSKGANANLTQQVRKYRLFIGKQYKSGSLVHYGIVAWINTMDQAHAKLSYWICEASN